MRGLRDAPDRIYGALNPGQCSFPPPPPPPLRRSFSGVARDAILSFFVANSTRPTNELKFIETNFFSICCASKKLLNISIQMLLRVSAVNVVAHVIRFHSKRRRNTRLIDFFIIDILTSYKNLLCVENVYNFGNVIAVKCKDYVTSMLLKVYHVVIS